MAVVRPEFRTEIYIPAPDDPVFVAEQCAVADCDRTRCDRRGLCNAHAIRCRKRGRPPMEEFLADPGPPVRGRRPLAACTVDGCRYGTRRPERVVLQAPRPVGPCRADPDLATWEAPDAGRRRAPGPAECRLPFCTLWTENPAKMFCTGHDDRWQRQGRPDPDRFIADCELRGTARIDLRDLAPQLKLEIQYALQRRHDARSRTAAPRLVMPAVRQVADGRRHLAAGPDRSSNGGRPPAPRSASRPCSCSTPATRWRRCATGPAGRSSTPGTSGGCTSCPASPPRPARPCPRARLRFDRITQPWLRELAKRWTRLRLASGLSIGAARPGWTRSPVQRVPRPCAGVEALADIDRPLLERYLAWRESQPGGPGVKKTRIGGLSLFFQAIRQHGWDDTLPGTAAFYPGDTPPGRQQVTRQLAEYVMTQVESPANLDRWPNPAGRLVTLILIRCGLRVSSALRPGLRLPPPRRPGRPLPALLQHQDETRGRRPHRRGTRSRHPRPAAARAGPLAQGTACLFPRSHANAGGQPRCTYCSYRAHAQPLAGDLRHPRRARPTGAPDTPPMAAHLRLPAHQPRRPAGSRPGPARP